jgi:hypothetical protein
VSFPRKKATLREADADLRRSSSTSQPSLGSANRTATDNKHSVASEVLIPPVLPRMKQPDERAAFRIKSTQVRTLVRIAVVAGESEVFAVVPSAMLSSNDVLDVIGEERLRALRKETVFAAMIGTFTDGLPAVFKSWTPWERSLQFKYSATACTRHQLGVSKQRGERRQARR